MRKDQAKWKFVAAAVSAVTLMWSGTGAAVAEVPSQQSDIRLHVKIDGKLVELDREFLSARSISKTIHSERQTNPSSRLIDWNQWFGCFSLNNENDVFANYMHYWNGSGQDVRLKCGNDSWGYKHVRAGKETQWQAKLDGARAAGWVPSTVGVDSWDDLMSGAAGAVVLWPEYRRVESVSNKICGNSEFYLLDLKTGRELYSFNVEVAWASDSDKLITAFPSSRLTC